MELTLTDVVNGAIGPFAGYCDGYGNPGASGVGYISVLTLSTGKVLKKMDHVLEEIVSYDRAEANDAYVGQINMIAASSFNGVNGAVWGYHLAKADAIVDGSLKPLLVKKRHDGVDIPIWPVEPLLDAGERLFGTVGARRFPLIPGGHVICAAKDVTVPGPTAVWSAIALAIAEDRDRDANLFIEDVGHSIPAENSADRSAHLDRLIENIAESIILCGEDQNVLYRELFIGYKTEWIPDGYVGCALTCAPYVVLARNAVPQGGPAAQMLQMTVAQWEKALGLK